MDFLIKLSNFWLHSRLLFIRGRRLFIQQVLETRESADGNVMRENASTILIYHSFFFFNFNSFRRHPSGVVPPCKSACLDPLPVPDVKSGLKLSAFLPVASTKKNDRLDPFSHYQTMKSFQEGDRFVFECEAGKDLGVYGGKIITEQQLIILIEPRVDYCSRGHAQMTFGHHQ